VMAAKFACSASPNLKRNRPPAPSLRLATARSAPPRIYLHQVPNPCSANPATS
jgi:hypothetical protein